MIPRLKGIRSSWLWNRFLDIGETMCSHTLRPPTLQPLIDGIRIPPERGDIPSNPMPDPSNVDFPARENLLCL